MSKAWNCGTHFGDPNEAWRGSEAIFVDGKWVLKHFRGGTTSVDWFYSSRAAWIKHRGIPDAKKNLKELEDKLATLENRTEGYRRHLCDLQAEAGE